VIGSDPAAAVFGAAIALSGGLGAASVAARHRERVLRRLGVRTARPRPRWAGIDGRLERLVRGRGWVADPRLYVLATLSLAAAGAALGWRVAGPVGSIAGGAAGGGVVEWWLARRRARLREDLEGQLREAVVALAAAVRAGLSIRLGFEEAVWESEGPLRATFQRLLGRIEVGEPLADALDGMAAELGSPEARLLVTALAVHRRSGGELPAMLEEVAEIIKQRLDARTRVRALTAQGRASGAVLAVLPVAFVTLLSGTSGDGLGAFYRTPLGAGLLIAGLVCEALGSLWIRRIVRASP